MELGAFSVSLAVKDLEVSRGFYEALGFEAFGGDADQQWLIMKSGDHLIGLFQGMFEKNMMTFNPGWTQDATEKDPFMDVRAIQARLKRDGIKLTKQADENTTGPASLMLTDPDGNQILIDQHR